MGIQRFYQRKITQDKTWQKGQTLLIVILVMIVALTISLSVASRSITSLKISKENEESSRAFQAAEAGLELAIKIAQKANEGQEIEQDSRTLDNNSRYSISTSGVAGGGPLNNDESVAQDRGIDVMLMDYDDFVNPSVNGSYTANVNIRWWKSVLTDCADSVPAEQSIPALEVIILSGNKNTPSIQKHFFDSCPRSNSASSVGSAGGGYLFSTNDITITNGIVMRVIPLYNSSHITVLTSAIPPNPPSSADLPDQGSILESIGSSGDTVRKISYFESLPEIPTEMYYSILSQ